MFVDNDTAFRSKSLEDFLSEWGVRLRFRFRCAHVPSGNGIVERCHRSVKLIAARKQCTIMEAVYWYNVTPKDNVSPLTAPANLIHRYHVRLKGIVAHPPDRPKQQSGYNVGDRVWMKTPIGRCTSPYTRGYVTGVISPQNILVDGMPRHVRDLRPLMGSSASESGSDSEFLTQSARVITINEAHGSPSLSSDLHVNYGRASAV